MALTKLVSSSLGTGVGGKVLQIQTTNKTDTFSTSSTSYVDITGLSVSITPTSSSNKIFVMAHVHIAHGASRGFYVKLLRNSTDLHIGDVSSNKVSATFGLSADEPSNTENAYTGALQYLDTPSTTSATTYKLQARIGSTNAGYINRMTSEADTVNSYRCVSGITVMEISV